MSTPDDERQKNRTILRTRRFPFCPCTGIDWLNYPNTLNDFSPGKQLRNKCFITQISEKTFNCVSMVMSH